MTLEQVSLGIAIAGVAVAIAGWLDNRFAMRERFAKIEVKVDTMWDFQLRRGMSEAVQKGAATMNSPVKVLPEAKEWFDGMAKELQAFFVQHIPKGATDSQIGMEIEKAYGNRILKDVCIPRQLTMGACLVVAIAVAKDVDTVAISDVIERPKTLA